jgi:DNA gyrase/topoisomerase IV subunit A
MAFTQIEQTPLETLVISQLAAIRKQEAALKMRLRSITSREVANMAAEVWKLQTSADRLNRMIDAMRVSETYVQPSLGQTAA